MEDITIQVAAKNGKAKRLVQVQRGDIVFRDELNVDNAAARKKFVQEVADQFNVQAADLAWLAMALVHHADQADAAAEAKAAQATDEQQHHQRQQPDPLLAMPEHIREAARVMLDDPYLLTTIADDIEAIGVAGEMELALSVYLIGTSRLLDRPLAAIVQGQSSSGKSFTVERVASLFPPEAKLEATSMTPQALFYMPANGLCHRFVVAGERSRLENDDTAEATRALREMLAAGRLSKLLPLKTKDGTIETVLIEQPGPIAYVETTTLTSIFDEDLNRALLLCTDERIDQTKRILRSIAAGAMGQSRGDAQAIRNRHFALQRMLQQFPVVVPFAEALAKHFPADRVTARRAFPQALGMVQAIALLHQRQRKLDGNNCIIAQREDYQFAYQLLAGPISRSVGRAISPAALRFFDRLKAKIATPDKFTTRDAERDDEGSPRSVRGWLHELVAAGAVDEVEESRGNKPASYAFTGSEPHNMTCLPSPSELFRE